MLIYKGDGIAKDVAESLRMWRLACEHRSRSGCFFAGLAYQLGEGTPVNTGLSHEYLRRGCDGELLPSCEELVNSGGDGCRPLDAWDVANLSNQLSTPPPVTPERQLKLLNACGIQFDPEPDILQRMRASGVPAEVLARLPTLRSGNRATPPAEPAMGHPRTLTPVMGEAVLAVWPPETKVDRQSNVVRTSIKVANPSANQYIQGLSVEEVWYDSSGAIVSRVSSSLAIPLRPEGEQTLILESPMSPKMDRNQVHLQSLTRQGESPAAQVAVMGASRGNGAFHDPHRSRPGV